MTQVKGDRTGLLARLKLAQDKSGCVSDESIAEIARALNIPLSDVYGVATFYSFLSHQPLGRNVIRVCKSVPCFLQSSETILERIGKITGIKPGETTADGKFSLELTNCIGACDNAPAMMINKTIYSGLTPVNVAQILNSYK